jgi:hypothetical protein
MRHVEGRALIVETLAEAACRRVEAARRPHRQRAAYDPIVKCFQRSSSTGFPGVVSIDCSLGRRCAVRCPGADATRARDAQVRDESRRGNASTAPPGSASDFAERREAQF